jgi:N-acetylmuramoyl-L-alanine amidase
LLKAAGIDFCYTVSPSDWQDVSLTERCKRADLVQKKKPAVLISIHSNAGPAGDQSARGFEVFTSPGQTKSDPIATIFFNEMKKEFPELKGRSMMGDGDPDKEGKFAMICLPKCRAILIETMFYTNPIECKMLMDPKVQDRIAHVILETIKKVELL